MAEFTITVDDGLFEQAQKVCGELGLELSVATVIFFKKLVRDNGIPFEVRADPFGSPENQKHLLAALERMEKTGGTPHKLLEVDVV